MGVTQWSAIINTQRAHTLLPMMYEVHDCLHSPAIRSQACFLYCFISFVVLNKIKLIEWLGICRKSFLINKRQRACVCVCTHCVRIAHSNCSRLCCNVFGVATHVIVNSYFPSYYLRNLEILQFCSDSVSAHLPSIIHHSIHSKLVSLTFCLWTRVASRENRIFYDSKQFKVANGMGRDYTKAHCLIWNYINEMRKNETKQTRYRT